jgi:hypothetical protein
MVRGDRVKITYLLLAGFYHMSRLSIAIAMPSNVNSRTPKSKQSKSANQKSIIAKKKTTQTSI